MYTDRKPILRAEDAGRARGFISYLRVSTDRQGRSGLGLEAQREAVSRYVASVAGCLMAEFQEVESGKNNARPELARALAACRLRRATLLIAKLDRLSRNLAFLANLMESGTEFVACDNPHATRFTIHILAAVAEHEREMISARTKAALAAARARGVKLGGPNLRPGSAETSRIACAAKSAQADAYAADVLPYLKAAREAGAATLGQLARALTARGVRTPGGRSEWSRMAVSRVLARVAQRRQ